MKYTKQSFSIELIGIRYGYLWNGTLASGEIHKVIGDKESLRQAVKSKLSEDFETAYLSPNSFVKITLIKFNRRIVRHWDIGLFSSVSQFIGDKDF